MGVGTFGLAAYRVLYLPLGLLKQQLPRLVSSRKQPPQDSRQRFQRIEASDNWQGQQTGRAVAVAAMPVNLGWPPRNKLFMHTL